MRWIGFAERVDRAAEAATDGVVKIGSLLWWLGVAVLLATAVIEIGAIALGAGAGR